MTREQADAIRTVETRYPPKLATQMPDYQPPAIRNAILAALGQASRQRSAEQLADRLERRWHRWGFADNTAPAKSGATPASSSAC